ncbi:MAG: thiolase domain-containing protein [Pararhodobacter sp.]|nr:thiolase domain-containing protein [Pararhodobacter sp.]
MTDAMIVGWAHGDFGKRPEPDLASLIEPVARAALEHAQVSPAEVDLISVGAFGAGFSPQGYVSAQVAMGLPELAHCPALHLENACATGSAALYAALDAIAAGRSQVALVVGAEKMTATPPPAISEIMLSGCYRREEEKLAGGLGFAGLFGYIAGEYFRRYGERSRELGMIAAKNHANGCRNPHAQFRKDLGEAFCTTVSGQNPLVAAPLRKTDCSPISDGAVALVLAAPGRAQSMPRALRFRARAQTGDHLPLSRRDPLEFAGARRAWAAALAEAGVTLDDLALVETHDCFTIAEMIQYEAMGLAPRGEGWRAVRDGIIRRDGALPVNPSGGLKARGHPIGATGVSQHVMVAMQLTGTAGEMQLPRITGPGAVFNMGGIAVSNYVSVLEAVK